VEVARLPDARLVVIGDGPRRGWLAERAPGVRFTGDLRGGDLPTAIASLDVLVHPGTRLTCAHALREARAAGVPVVAARAGGRGRSCATSRRGCWPTRARRAGPGPSSGTGGRPPPSSLSGPWADVLPARAQASLRSS
jgi:hypothetical protein